jgi:hypothetical protein
MRQLCAQLRVSLVNRTFTPASPTPSNEFANQQCAPGWISFLPQLGSLRNYETGFGRFRSGERRHPAQPCVEAHLCRLSHSTAIKAQLNRRRRYPEFCFNL